MNAYFKHVPVSLIILENTVSSS